jgi:glutathione S-transferase
MKLYLFPGSAACRAVQLFMAEAGIEYEPVVVDVLSGEQFEGAYAVLNPSSLVPTLDDDGFVLTESSAILKYLADRMHSPAYPKDLRRRAKVNETMDWFNTQFYREYGYSFVYPQTFSIHRLEPEEGQRNLVARGKERATFLLGVLDDHWLGDGRPFLCGDELTIADCQGAGILTVGDLVGQRFDDYPNIDRWIESIKARPSWAAVQEGLVNLVEYFSEGRYATIGA